MTETQTAQHSPGPWKAGPHGKARNCSTVTAPNGHVVAYVQGARYESGRSAEDYSVADHEQQIANAQLIAAVPELLAEAIETERLLSNLIEDLGRIAGVPVMRGLRKRHEAIRAIIAKATA